MRSSFLSDGLSMLRQSGCLFGKFNALLTSHTAAPAVSASVTSLSKLPSCRPVYSVRIIGLSDLISLSAIASIAAGSGAIGEGCFTASAGGSSTLSISGSSCSAAS